MISSVRIFEIVALLVVCIGSFFSLSLMAIIIDMNIWTDYIKLIFAMTLFQFIFDALLCSDLLGYAVDTKIGAIIESIILLGGTTSFTISCIVSFTVFHVLYYKHALDMKKWRPTFISIVSLINISWFSPVIVGILSEKKLIFVGFMMTTGYRLVAIILNFTFYLVNYSIVRGMRASASSSSSSILSKLCCVSAPMTKITSEQERAMLALVDRMKW